MLILLSSPIEEQLTYRFHPNEVYVAYVQLYFQRGRQLR